MTCKKRKLKFIAREKRIASASGNNLLNYTLKSLKNFFVLDCVNKSDETKCKGWAENKEKNYCKSEKNKKWMADNCCLACQV